MSVVFVVRSEEALSSGTPWCKRFSEVKSSRIHVAVIGLDRKVLLEHSRSKVAEQLDQPADQLSIQTLSQDVNEVLKFVRQVNASTLFLLHGADGAEFEQKLFEKSPVRTVWLRVASPPPTSADQVSVAMQSHSILPTSFSEKLLGLIPGQVLTDRDADDSSAAEFLLEIRAKIDAEPHPGGDLVLFGIDETGKSSEVYSAALTMLSDNGESSVALLRNGETLSQSLKSKVKHWAESVAPPMERQQRLDLVKDLETGSSANLEFLGLMSAASMLAAFGLLQNSAAVIIGAMLIAPLMTPVLGAGLALTHGNRPLFQASLLTIAFGFVGALVASILFGWLVWLVRPTESDHINWITAEMWTRCRPSPLDFCVGLVGGMAAAYARTRSHLSSALAGAAIAAALVPPISTAGLQLAFGLWGQHEKGLMVGGPVILVSINVLTIMIGASFILWARGMRPDAHLSGKVKWAPRMVALLLAMTALVLVLLAKPTMIFPT